MIQPLLSTSCLISKKNKCEKKAYEFKILQKQYKGKYSYAAVNMKLLLIQMSTHTKNKIILARLYNI
jgi:hypothetical protein